MAGAATQRPNDGLAGRKTTLVPSRMPAPNLHPAGDASRSPVRSVSADLPLGLDGGSGLFPTAIRISGLLGIRTTTSKLTITPTSAALVMGNSGKIPARSLDNIVIA